MPTGRMIDASSTGTEVSSAKGYLSIRSDTGLLDPAPSRSSAPSRSNDRGLTGGVAGQVRFEPPPSTRSKASGGLDPILLGRLSELVENAESAEGEEVSIILESLRCVTCELWNSAASASQYHHSILAIIEAFVGSVDHITMGQASALRGAVIDLKSPNLTERHVEIARSRFIDEGHNPLAILSSLQGEENGRDGTN